MSKARISVEGPEGAPERQPTSDAPSATRLALSRDVPWEWLDRLLVTFTAITPTTPLMEALGSLLTVSREVLEDVAIGVCIPGADGQQLVVRRPDRVSQVGAPSAVRLFPEHDGERTIAIPGEEGATLHVGAADRARLGEAELQLYVDRLAQVLAAVIRSHRAGLRAASPDVHRLQDQVIQLEKLASLGQMVAGIVHEINNPLTSIVAYADYLRKKVERAGGDAADVDRLARINEAAERILRFSRDLTEYSRPRKVVPASVMLHDVIDRALGFCEHELDQTGVMVERKFGEIPPVSGVAGQLTQVFVNLFTNAAHAMRAQGGLLTITTSMPTATEIEVVVSDDGHGIDDETLPKIFDPFFTTKVDGHGTGLGLSIVRSIVVNHGGRILAASNTPKGTVFRVGLPVVPAADDRE